MEDKQVYSPKQAAEYLSVTRDHVLRLIKSGKIEASDIGLGQRHVLRITQDSLDVFLSKNKKDKNERTNNTEN